jgi:two-component system, chemotaxis family, protein-glutamate methylesterase/glutaminase
MIRVLVIDDSAVVRQVLSKELCKAEGIEVVATAVDAFAARDKIVRLEPDVVTLDLQMPRMNGLTFLGKLMKYHPLPVIVVSSMATKGSDAAMQAMELGATDVVCKPGPGYSVSEIVEMLVDKIRAAAQTRRLHGGQERSAIRPVDKLVADLSGLHDKVIAVGASTGGIEALRILIGSMPADAPGILVVQHLPAKFTATFAERLNGLCDMEVREARDGDVVEPGVALIAPGNLHMRVSSGLRNTVHLTGGPRIFHHRPSIDVLFHSVAKSIGADAIGVILTGMGADGARGLLAMRQAGARTCAQDEESCVVFGMPKEAIRIGAAEATVSLEQIPSHILTVLRRKRSAS